MKYTFFIVLLTFITCRLFAQDVTSSDNGTVIYPTSFQVTLPLRDLVKLYPAKTGKEWEENESPDRLHRPPQTFLFSAADGPEYGEDPSVRQTTMGTRHINNKSLMVNWAGQNSDAYPPDPTGASGPNHYVQCINASPFSVYDKTNGSVLLTANLSSLWSSSVNDGDPIVLYDKFADRWFLSQFGTSNNSIYIAISTTSDPTGSYYTYTFTSPQFPDYLKFSVWENGYYMTSNQSTDKVFCFERSQMLIGNPQARSVYQTFTTGAVSGFFIPLPCDASEASSLPSAGTPFPFMSYYDNAWGSGTDGVKIWNMTVVWGTTATATITAATQVNTSAFDASYNSNWDDVTQPGTSQKLDGIGGVLNYRAQWTNWTGYNAVVLNWGVYLSSTQRSIRWCELRQDQSTGTWSLYQEGTYTPDSDTRWMGSIAMDVNGSIGLAYCKSSSTTYPSLCFTGRLAGDPLGVMTFAETVVVSGTSSQTGTNRYGDYSQTSLDPDGITFWHTGEYISNGPKTRIFSFQLPAGNMPPIVNFSANPTVTTCSGDVQFSDMTANLPDSWFWDFGDGQTSTIQSPAHTYQNGGTYTVSLICTNVYGSDTLIKPNYVTINVADVPSVTDGYACSSESIILNATGNGEVHWYDSPTGGTELGTGPTYTTPVLTSDVTYYVENHIVQPTQYVGIASTSSGGSYSNTAYSLSFDCYSPVVLVSVIVNKQTAGNAVFQMLNSSGSVLHTNTFTLPAGETTVTLNWDIPVGTGMTLGCTTGGFYRNNTSVSYPYTLSGLISITTSSSGSNRYGPFFNWEIKPPDCVSARVPITAFLVSQVVPTVSLLVNDPVICAGSAATFTASATYGGSTPTYQWFVDGAMMSETSNVLNTTQVNDGSVVYCIMTSSISCAVPASATSNSVNIQVDVTVASTVSINASNNQICQGNEVTFSAIPVNGGTTPSYAWFLNNVHVGNNSQTYSTSNLEDGDAVYCKLTSSLACVTGSPATSNTQNIGVYSAPATPTITYSDNTLYSSSTTGNQWYYLSTGFPITNATEQSYVPTMNGDYFVIVTDGNGCASDTSNIITVSGLGINNLNDQTSFEVFPNPASDEFVIYLPNGTHSKLQFRIVNALGQTLMQKEIKEKATKIPAKSLINGVYYVEILNDKTSNVKRLLIQK